VVGLGAIGGSLALALGRTRMRVRGYTLDGSDRAAARAAGVDVADAGDEAGLATAVADAAVIVLAVPMSSLRQVAERALDAAVPDAAVFHVSSLQRRDTLGLDAAPLERVVGTHPMAGTHERGFAAARAGMFEGATVLVEARAGRASRAAAEALWRGAGAARVEYRSAEAHDDEMAWVSHLPQLGATAIAAALAARATAPELVGPGGRDTTRLAESPFELWAEILARAPEETLAALDAVERQIAAIRYSIVHADWAGLAVRWEQARAWRRAVGRG